MQVLRFHQTFYTLWPSRLGNYMVLKKLVVQTPLWSLEFVIQSNSQVQHHRYTILGALELPTR